MEAQPTASWRGTAGLTALTDHQLVDISRGGDEVAQEMLLIRYRDFVRLRARSYFLIGADRDDLLQEGMIGLYEAIRDYRPDRRASFKSFANLCVRRQMITAIKQATRKKHALLNSCVSLDEPACRCGGGGGGDGGGQPLADAVCLDTAGDPMDMLIDAEEIRAIQHGFIRSLSDLEAEVLVRHADGKSYREIASELGRHVKSIDNALQRVKRKIAARMSRRRESRRA